MHQQPIPVVFIGHAEKGPVYGQINLNNFLKTKPKEEEKVVLIVTHQQITTSESGQPDFMRFVSEEKLAPGVKSVMEKYWEENPD